MRLIDADNLTEMIESMIKTMKKMPLICKETKDSYRATLMTVKEIVRDTPTVEAKPEKPGHWIKDEDGDKACSICGNYAEQNIDGEHIISTAYCSRCGAKMDKKQS